MSPPRYGIAENKLVITVAPQKDIWPHGKTYPKKAVAITINKIVTPTIHTNSKIKDL
jgi:predicted P-loop ATPase/GTPase